MDLPFPEAIL